MMDFLIPFLTNLEHAVIVYFLAVNGFYLILFISTGIELGSVLPVIRGESRWRVLGSTVAPRISVLAPAYNEGATIGQSVPALLALYYPNLEIIVINDGSKDDTLGVVRKQFDLAPVHPIYRRQVPTKPIVALYRS